MTRVKGDDFQRRTEWPGSLDARGSAERLVRGGDEKDRNVLRDLRVVLDRLNELESQRRV